MRQSLYCDIYNFEIKINNKSRIPLKLSILGCFSVPLYLKVAYQQNPEK